MYSPRLPYSLRMFLHGVLYCATQFLPSPFFCRCALRCIVSFSFFSNGIPPSALLIDAAALVLPDKQLGRAVSSAWETSTSATRVASLIVTFTLPPRTYNRVRVSWVHLIGTASVCPSCVLFLPSQSPIS